MQGAETPTLATIPAAPNPSSEPTFDLDKGVNDIVFTTLDILNYVIIIYGNIAESIGNYLGYQFREYPQHIQAILRSAHCGQRKIIKEMNKFICMYKTADSVITLIEEEAEYSPVFSDPASIREDEFGRALKGHQRVANANNRKAVIVYKCVDKKPEYINRAAYNDTVAAALEAINSCICEFSEFNKYLNGMSGINGEFRRFSERIRTYLKELGGIAKKIEDPLEKARQRLGMAEAFFVSIGTTPLVTPARTEGPVKIPRDKTMESEKKQPYDIKLLVVDPIKLVNTLSKDVSAHMLDSLEEEAYSAEEGPAYRGAIKRINMEILVMCGQVHRHYYDGVRLRGPEREQRAPEYIPEDVSEIPGESEEKHMRRLASALVHFYNVSYDMECILAQNYRILEEYYDLRSFYTPIQDALNTLNVIFTRLGEATALAVRADTDGTHKLKDVFGKYLTIVEGAATEYEKIHRRFSFLATCEGVDVKMLGLPHDPAETDGRPHAAS